MFRQSRLMLEARCKAGRHHMRMLNSLMMTLQLPVNPYHMADSQRGVLHIHLDWTGRGVVWCDLHPPPFPFSLFPSYSGLRLSTRVWAYNITYSDYFSILHCNQKAFDSLQNSHGLKLLHLMERNWIKLVEAPFRQGGSLPNLSSTVD